MALWSAWNNKRLRSVNKPARPAEDTFFHHTGGFYDGADWFHFTGITPALGGELVSICKDACIAAKRLGIKISCDLNYRSKLWSRQEACAAMTELCQYVDICISNEEDAKDVFENPPPHDPYNIEMAENQTRGEETYS